MSSEKQLKRVLSEYGIEMNDDDLKWIKYNVLVMHGEGFLPLDEDAFSFILCYLLETLGRSNIKTLPKLLRGHREGYVGSNARIMYAFFLILDCVYRFRLDAFAEQLFTKQKPTISFISFLESYGIKHQDLFGPGSLRRESQHRYICEIASLFEDMPLKHKEIPSILVGKCFSGPIINKVTNTRATAERMAIITAYAFGNRISERTFDKNKRKPGFVHPFRNEVLSAKMNETLEGCRESDLHRAVKTNDAVSSNTKGMC